MKENITLKQAKTRVEKLRTELSRHNHLYYVENNPQISDYEFDRLLRELIEIEKIYPKLFSPDSPSNRIGGIVAKGFTPFKHIVPMMSILKWLLIKELN